ncbi:NUDIX domain-containing protein [Thermobifida halotolerans]|uniref:NUDIX domain-containing protein n=1 Tax=Thermobifida halotolerans TaxID=483545 RepID=A0AA97LUJ8_9ACTN|nr:NUDIX domain-containing protein [Thermobifida halotolerans]UOE18327.1 NUDIX domain-containing protein [Thermobifida halotolerans]
MEIAEGIEIPETDDGRRWVVGAVVVDAEGRAFVQRRSPDRALFPNAWDIVGGHVEAGEGVVEALEREVREETGWRLTGVLAELCRLAWTPDDGVERFEVDYLVRVEGDLGAPVLEPDRHTGFAWVDESRLDMLTTPEDPGHTFVADVVGLGLRRARELRS